MPGPLCVHGTDIRPSINQYYKGQLNRCNAHSGGFLCSQSTGEISSERWGGLISDGVWSQTNATGRVIFRR